MILQMHNEIVNISVRKVFNNLISNCIYKLIYSIMTILANYRLKSAHVNIINRSSHFSLLHHNNQISPNYTVFSVNSSPNYELYQIIEQTIFSITIHHLFPRNSITTHISFVVTCQYTVQFASICHNQIIINLVKFLFHKSCLLMLVSYSYLPNSCF